MIELPDRIPVRDQIIAHLVKRFEDSTPRNGERFVAWGQVWDQDAPANSSLIGDADIAIVDGRETKSAEVGRFRCTLQLTTEFRVKLALGDNKRSLARAVLAEVQSIMLADIYCGGLCLNLVERANELNVEGTGDTLVSGIVFWDVQYRHAHNDPYQRI